MFDRLSIVILVWTSYDEELGSCTVNWKSKSALNSVNASFPDTNSDSLTELDFKKRLKFESAKLRL